MNKRVFGMAPGGRLALDRAANRRRNVWFVQQKQMPRERKGADVRLVLPPKKAGDLDG